MGMSELDKSTLIEAVEILEDAAAAILQLNGNLKGKYFYGSSSSMSNGFLTRSTIETMISNAGGGGSDGSDHNHDSRYPRMSTGTSSNPSPSTGDFYLDTSRKVLYIGV